MMFPRAGCAFLFAQVAAAYHLRANGGPRGAEALGAALRAAGAEMAGGSTDEQAAFRSAFAGEFAAQELVPVNAAVARVVDEANMLASTQHTADGGACARNWEAPCPDGWSAGGNLLCEAPGSYDGGCAKLHSFQSVGVDSRAVFASECSAPWPCADGCAEGRNYDGCPASWVDSGDGYCSGGGGGPCLSEYKFDTMSIAHKQELSLSCSIEWPCRG